MPKKQVDLVEYERSTFDPNNVHVNDVVSVPFSTPYNRRKVNSKLDFSKGVSLTKQCFKDDCDINNILRKYETTGVLPEVIKTNPQYGDFSDVLSYEDSLNVVAMAQEQFSYLSAKVRRRFDNDPAKFLEFVDDPSNLEESYDLGIRLRPAPVEGSARASSEPVLDVQNNPLPKA